MGLGRAGPVVFYRGRRYRSTTGGVSSGCEPFRVLGYELLAGHLRAAAEGRRSGDLVLYGAFAEAGSIAFDFEFGSHGGVGPEELDQFVIHPAGVEWPLRGAVGAEAVPPLLSRALPCRGAEKRSKRRLMRLRVVSWNVHGCVGTDRRFAPDRTAEVLRALRPDVALLQEVGDSRGVHPPVDQAESLATRWG